MFAILESGGKQYKVEEGDILEVELLEQEKISKQNKYTFSNILLVKGKETLLGTPFVKNAMVTASVLEEIKAPKVIVFKKKSKKQYKKTKGHRQKLHKVQIDKIEIKAETKKKAAPAKEEAKKTTPKKPAAKKAAPKTEKKEK
ncbi:MAG: 50S ribosomal protein L21 [Acidobacteriota bacterium]